MNYLTGMYVKATTKLGGLVKNERGSQTLEWIGIAAVIVILVGVISTAFAGGDLGETVKTKFTSLLDKMVAD
ncbi:hypothetical protein F7984_01690 [Pradoshia sp. D12]|uniref:hypothetical protein n=1 Tax=Bacillaceae TaxID=186817 RepID=UPI00080AD075|nr:MULTISPECIES: hypothetical protein [Bacillaceae]OCA80726.1 hypothetical protein A8L44_16285 [Bacillus sp. FJAT-27986]QFK70064.1 hypothetical protein F7984_01690 [Pradoshia sp. D12]TPF70624.1 hypothetical protein FHY44_16825 [Bacillus sp. D12]